MNRRDFVKSSGALIALTSIGVQAQEKEIIKYEVDFKHYLTRNILLKYKDHEGNIIYDMNRYGEYWALIGDAMIKPKGANIPLREMRRMTFESTPELLHKYTQDRIDKWIKACIDYCLNTPNDSIRFITQMPTKKEIPYEL